MMYGVIIVSKDLLKQSTEIVSHKTTIAELKVRKSKALGMGGKDKLKALNLRGVLNARERIEYLLDQNTFIETGLFSTSHRKEVQHKTPADGKISGFGKIHKRPVALVSNDFTVLGASSSVINGKKMKHIKEAANKRGLPVIFLAESAGARMPDRMGAPGRAILGQDPLEYRRDRKTPWVSALLGPCFGSSTWYACLSDFVVMKKGAILAVASNKVTSIAIKQEVDSEELGGWKLHSTVTGLVDRVVEDDKEALDEIKKFLSYFPSHNNELPPIHNVQENKNNIDNILNILPESKHQVYDSKKITDLIFDDESAFELKRKFGKSINTSLYRLKGETVGVIASNPKNKGGAIDVDSCRKVTSFLILCDSFNIPIIFLVDQPGFLIGLEGEKRGAPGLIMNWMNALTQVTVPKISITMRKNYGQAFLNMGGGRNSNEVACWPMADLGFMDPSTSVNVLYGLKKEDDPIRFEKLVEEISQDSSAWALAGLNEAQHILDPRDTRDFLIDILSVHNLRRNKDLGQHLLCNWPTTI